MRQLLFSFDPEVYLTVHSGDLALGMPHAYDFDEADRNADKMYGILESLQEYCPHCTIGPIAEELGYKCPGNSMDYAYEVIKVSYSFTFEIYESHY